MRFFFFSFLSMPGFCLLGFLSHRHGHSGHSLGVNVTSLTHWQALPSSGVYFPPEPVFRRQPLSRVAGLCPPPRPCGEGPDSPAQWDGEGRRKSGKGADWDSGGPVGGKFPQRGSRCVGSCLPCTVRWAELSAEPFRLLALQWYTPSSSSVTLSINRVLLPGPKIIPGEWEMFTLVGLDDRENSHVCDTTLFLSLCLWMRKSELCFPWVSAAGLVLSRLSRGTFWSSEPPLWRWRSDPGQRERWGSCLHLGRAHVKEVCVCITCSVVSNSMQPCGL